MVKKLSCMSRPGRLSTSSIDPRAPCVQCSLRGAAPRRTRCAQPLAAAAATTRSIFPFGRSRQCVERHHVLRQHVCRQVLAQMHHQRIEVEAGALGEREVGHQAHVAGAGLRGPRPRCAPRRPPRSSAPRSRRARCGSRAPSPGSRAGRGARAARRCASGRGRPSGTTFFAGAEDAHRDEALGGQLGAIEVAQRHAIARDADLARHADGAGLQVGVEDPDRRCWRRACRSTRRATRSLRGERARPWSTPLFRSGRSRSTGASMRSQQRQRHARAAAPRRRSIPRKPGAPPAHWASSSSCHMPGVACRSVICSSSSAAEQAIAVHGDFALHHHESRRPPPAAAAGRARPCRTTGS